MQNFRTEIENPAVETLNVNLVEHLLLSAEENLDFIQEAFERQLWDEAQFYGYNAVIELSKALLVHEGIQMHPNCAVINRFREAFVTSGRIPVQNYEKLTMIELIDRSKSEVNTYVQEVIAFYGQVVAVIDEY